MATGVVADPLSTMSSGSGERVAARCACYEAGGGMRGIVFDLPETVAETSSGLGGRCRFRGRGASSSRSARTATSISSRRSSTSWDDDSAQRSSRRSVPRPAERLLLDGMIEPGRRANGAKWLDADAQSVRRRPGTNGGAVAGAARRRLAGGRGARVGGGALIEDLSRRSAPRRPRRCDSTANLKPLAVPVRPAGTIGPQRAQRRLSRRQDPRRLPAARDEPGDLANVDRRNRAVPCRALGAYRAEDPSVSTWAITRRCWPPHQ